MFDRSRAWVWAQLTAIKPAFVSRAPHFSFITTHYFWIIGMTILASILIFASGKGELDYIDALLFASGANTQAGLNPVDLNLLNTFQQVVIYLFAMISCPITLHGSVVFLRLYWFEKRFQGVVRDAKQRRTTLTKSKSQARGEMHRAEEGVNGRHITIMPRNGKSPRMTNDGILLDGVDEDQPKAAGKSDDSDTTTVTGERPNSVEVDHHESPDRHLHEHDQPGIVDASNANEEHGHGHHTGPHAITFADTVKRSDGVEDLATKFPQHRSNAEHIAILERQRNQDNEVLRIPGPRDAERGSVPRRLEEHDANDDDETIFRARTVESRPDNTTTESSRNIHGRQPTIVIAEPDRRKRDEVADNAKAAGSALESLRFRKPRVFNSKQKTVHEDDEEPRTTRAVRTKTLDTIRSVLSRDKADDMPYLSYNPTIGRNSNFIGLTLEEREELGGIEYRSLRTLALILLLYFWGFSLLAVTCLLPYILHHNYYGKIVTDDGISRTWWGFWTANSAFMDLGFTLTPDSMNSFNTSAFTLMAMWFFIIIGNTGFPVMLRFLIWIAAQLVPSGTGLWEELRFLLDHPRRCFTLLFPSAANWWLFWILVGLHALDLLFFIILDLGSGPIAELPVHTRVVDGLFQAASTRTAGFSCVNIALLHPAMPVLYVIMMYISVFPIAISIRRTNVYEEKSLGIYSERPDDDMDEATARSYVGTHLRRQLSFDLWYVFLGLFILAISEGGKIQDGKFDIFDVLFEVVSAYGTVGLSMGVPWANASLCSQFSVVGKLVIAAMMIRGRHRGLPYGLDRAVLLPSESRFKKEAEEAEAISLARTTTAVSGVFASGAQRRNSSVGRGRSVSRERERTNSNIITQFLHPGPVVPHDALHSHRRTKSSESRVRPIDELRRTQTEIPIDEEAIELEPVPSPTRVRPRRAETTVD